MLDLILLVAVLDVILILVVPEKIWLTIHRKVRGWVKQLTNKIKTLSD